MVPKRCSLKSCPSVAGPERTLFRFPADLNRRKSWYNAIAPELPSDTTLDDLNNKVICDLHFKPIMYAMSGNRRKRLFCNACPDTVDPVTPRVDVERLQLLADVTKKSKAVQVSVTQCEIITLKKKIKALENKIIKLKADPPASLIHRNRHKLAAYVSDEAYALFDCAVQNQQRGTHAARHTNDVKKIALSLANTCRYNRKVYKMVKSMFVLPSYRTLGRYAKEMGIPMYEESEALNIPLSIQWANSHAGSTMEKNNSSMRQTCTCTCMCMANTNIENMSGEVNHLGHNLNIENVSSSVNFVE